MSENTNNAVVENDILIFDVEVKNPESGKINRIKIVEGEVEKGKAKGNTRLEPENIAMFDVNKAIELWGVKLVNRVFIQPKIKALSTAFTREALTKTEIVDGKKITSVETDKTAIVDEYSRLFGPLSARGESSLALKRREKEILMEMQKLMEKLIVADATSPEFKAIREKALELNAELEDVRKSLAEKKADDADDTDDADDNGKGEASEKNQPVTA